MDRNHPTEYLHLNLTYYEGDAPNTDEAPTTAEAGTLSSRNLTGATLPQTRIHHQQYRLTESQRQNMKALIKHIYDEVERIVQET